ncbi:MAG: SDR family NAD(P)-dependent oxidoreductase [Bacteroidetes bacterium]|nr:SDR family NAD(P)-dependent oxidoreductase [Bacteroidota bacterium]
MNEKKIALITGVTRETGLGAETARQLRQLGFTVIVTGRTLERVSAIGDSIGCVSLELDITDEESIGNAAGIVRNTYGKLDVLVNNAAAFFDQQGSLLSTRMAYIQEAFDTNVLGALRTIRGFMDLLLKSDAGRIVNVSSGAGSFADPVFGMAVHPSHVPVYSITKLALNGLTVKLARELKDTNIRINAVCPGFVATWPGTAEFGARPVSDGARGIVWAATLPPDGPGGGFFRDGKPINW